LCTRGPQPRAAHAMVPDPTDDSVLLFGGRSLNRFFGDTWRWDGSAWSQVSQEGPLPRAFHGMASCRREQAVALFGGWTGAPSQRTHFGDVWSWKGGAWKRLNEDGPPAGGVYAMACEDDGQRVIFHGGGRKADGNTWRLQDQTWLRRDGTWKSIDPSQS
ncbi:kelch repeat-containing protein, partial [Candidatus Bipolaricaulota bacterium]